MNVDLAAVFEVLRRRPRLFERMVGVAIVVVGLGLTATAAGWVASRRTVPGATLAPPLGGPSARPRLVEFYAPGCPACDRARPSVEALRRDCAGRRLEIVELDATDPRNSEVARRHRVTAVPTFVMLGPAGEEEGRLVGAPELDELRAAAAALLRGRCVEAAGTGEPWQAPGADGAGCPRGAPATGAGDEDLPSVAPAADPAELLPFEPSPEPICEG